MTFGFGKVDLEVLLSLGHLLCREIALFQFAVESLQLAAVNHFQRVNNVAERLGHLTAFLVSDHGMQVHLSGGLSREHLEDKARGRTSVKGSWSVS